MKAVITVVGKDMVGILAKVSTECANSYMNVTEVTQSVLQDIFVMIMIIEFTDKSIPLAKFAEKMSALGKANGLDIRVMHEDIFNSMHHI